MLKVTCVEEEMRNLLKLKFPSLCTKQQQKGSFQKRYMTKHADNTIIHPIGQLGSALNTNL